MPSNEALRTPCRAATGKHWNRRSAVVLPSSATNVMLRATAVFSLVNGSKLQASDNLVSDTETFNRNRLPSNHIHQQLRTNSERQEPYMLNIDAIHMREINMPLAHPFETSFGLTTGRRILLIELESDGLTAWGECVAGEHPYFSDETIDTAWIITETELGPSLLDANVERRRQLPGDLPAGARPSHGQGGARKRSVGSRSPGREHLARRASRRHPHRHSLRRLHRHSAFAGAVDGQDRDRARRRLSAHQAEVQARLG